MFSLIFLFYPIVRSLLFFLEQQLNSVGAKGKFKKKKIAKIISKNIYIILMVERTEKTKHLVFQNDSTVTKKQTECNMQSVLKHNSS